MDLPRNKSQPQQKRPHAIRDVLPKRPASGQLVNFSGGHQVTPLGALDPQRHWTKKLGQSEMLFFCSPFYFCQKLCPHDIFILFIEFRLFVYFLFFFGGGANVPKKLCMVKTNKTFRQSAQKTFEQENQEDSIDFFFGWVSHFVLCTWTRKI